MSNGTDGSLSQADIDALLNPMEEDADFTQEKSPEPSQDADRLAGLSSDSPLDNNDIAGLESLLGSPEPKTQSPAVKTKKSSKSSKGNELDNSENMELLLDVKMNLSVEIGRTRMKVEEVLGLGSGAIVELDKLNGELVDIMVNNRLVARGEVVAVDESYGVKIIDIIDPEERFKIEL